MSSTQPISTTRWPSAGSKPVVSVSRTTSRIFALFLGAPTIAQCGQNHFHLVESVLEALVRHNHEMRFCTLFFVGHLARMQIVEFLGRHAGTRQHPFTLDMGWRADDDNCVHVALAAG